MNQMLVSTIFLLLILKLYRAQAHFPVRGASCIRLDNTVYILGGQKYSKGWEALKYIYFMNLEGMYHSELGKASPRRLTDENYEIHALYTTATAPSEENLFYYLMSNSTDIEDATLNVSLPTFKLTNIIPNSRKFELKSHNISFSQELSASQLSLVTNDMSPSEIVLLGAKAKINDVMAGSINIFDKELKTWETISAPFMIDDFYLSAVYRGYVYVFGPGIDTNKLNIDGKQLSNDQETLILVKFNIKQRAWKLVESKGNIPSLKNKPSFTYYKEYVFVTGENEKSNGNIHILNLNVEVPQWIRVPRSNFTSFKAGCLSYYKGSLYHYLGSDNPGITQKIDTHPILLHFTFNHDDSHSKFDSESRDSNMFPIILGLSGVPLTLGLIAITVCLIRRRRKLKPPKVYQHFVICEPPMDIYSENSNLTASRDLTQSDNLDLFKINELTPEECFNKNLSMKYNLSEVLKTKI